MRFTATLLLACLALAGTAAAAAPKPAAGQCAALAAIGSQLDPGNRNLKWTGANCCAFKGVTCSARGFVTALALQGLGLAGSVSKVSFKPLAKTLKSIDLSDNKLIGKLPASWGEDLRLTGNQKLWLASNNLSGTIPKSYGKIGTGMFMVLGNPNLKGCVPKGFALMGYGSASYNTQTQLTGFCK